MSLSSSADKRIPAPSIQLVPREMADEEMVTTSSNQTTWVDILEEFKERLVRLNDANVLALISLYGLVILVGLAGNCFILYFVFKSKHSVHGRARNHVLVNLCIADLLVVLVCCPMAIYTTATKVWTLGDPLCKSAAYLQGVAVTAGTMSLTALSLDRYLFIRHPTSCVSISRRHLAAAMIAMVWLTATLISIPILFVRTTQQLHIGPLHVTFCVEQWQSNTSRRVFTFLTLAVVYLMPCAVLVACHASVSCTLCTTTNQRSTSLNRNDQRQRSFRVKSSDGSSYSIPRAPPPTREDSNSTCRGTNPIAIIGNEDFPSGRSSSTIRIRNEHSHQLSGTGSRGGSTSGSRQSTASRSTPSRKARSHSTRTRRRLANLLMGMTVCFVACWLPYNISSFYIDLYPSPSLVAFLPFTLLIGHAHSSINPIVYWLLNKNARRKMHDVIRFRSGLQNSQESRSGAVPIAVCLPFHFGRDPSPSTRETAMGAFNPKYIFHKLPSPGRQARSGNPNYCQAYQ